MISADVDILVVGAGPAGLVAAATAAEAGCSVMVVERQAEIAADVRTSGATAHQTLRKFGVPRELYHVPRWLRIATTERSLRFDCRHEEICVIDVRGVYRWLAERASEWGASIFTGTRAIEPVFDRSGAVAGCILEGEGVQSRVDAKVVIDAGGYRAQMSKQAGLHSGFRRFGVGAEYELLTPAVDQDELVLILSERHAPSGYAWAFPWGQTRVRVGVGVHHADVQNDPLRCLDVLSAEANVFDLDLSQMKRTEVHHGLIPADGLAQRMAGNGIIAVGDAAGQATLVVGEGIRMAMEAGRLAGDVARGAVADGCADSGRLGTYEREFRRRFEKSLRIGYSLNKRLSAQTDPEWNKSIALLDDMPPSLVVQLLQSQVPLGDLTRWIIRRPRRWAKAAPLVQALVASARS